MRVKEDLRPQKLYPEEGKTHYGVITEYKYQTFSSRATGKPLKGLRIMIRPNDPKYTSVTAFGWIGEDEQGLYIYKGSRLEEWIKRILNVPDLSNIRLDSIIGAPCLFTVKFTQGENPETHAVRQFCNVSDIMSLPNNIPVMPTIPTGVNQSSTPDMNVYYPGTPAHQNVVNPAVHTGSPVKPNIPVAQVPQTPQVQSPVPTGIPVKNKVSDALNDGDLL